MTVENPKQAELLSDTGSFRYFKPFLAKERTVSQAAAEVGCNLDTMLYRVKIFLAAGLLQVTRLEPRAGRPVKHYRSVEDAYLIPLSATPYADVEELVRGQMQAGQDLLIRAVAKYLRNVELEGRRVYRRRDNGEVWQESAGESKIAFDFLEPESYRNYFEKHLGPVAEAFANEFLLTDEEAKAFLLELYALWFRYQGKENEPTRKPYYFSLGFVPLEP